MARFEEYLEKTEPEDTDISVLYDGDENATKKFSLGNLVKWMLNRAKIGLLETNAKTVTDSINEVNTRAKTNTARIEAIEKNPVKSENLNGQVFGLAWIYWTNNLVTGDGLENDAITYSKHDIIATQCLHLDKLASSKPTLTSDSIIILKRAKELNPKLRHFEYIQSDSGRIDFSYNGDHAHLNPNGSWEGSTADLSGSSRIYTFAQFCDWFDWFKKQGADGVFFDDWGYDFAKEDICYQFGWNPDNYENLNATKNEKWKKLIDACHERGLAVITNGGTPFEIGDWYTHLDENDIIALESCMISSAGNTWNNGHKSIYNYYTNWYSTGKCKAKLWSLDYTPSGSKEFKNQILTYLCAMGLACGVNYISMGVAGRIEKPFFVEIFTRGTQKKIVKIDDNTYSLSVGRHQLEVHRWSGLSGAVSQSNISKNYYIYDGETFNNGFKLASTSNYELSKQMNNVTKTIGGLTEDTRKNASSYWRMAIDDWQESLSYLDYNNLILQNASNFVCNYPGQALAEIVKNNDGTVDLIIKYINGNSVHVSFDVITSSNYENFKLTGESLEFGFSDVIFDMEEGSWTLPNGTAYYGSSLWAIPSFRPHLVYTVNGTYKDIEYIKGVSSDVGETNGHYERTQRGEITAAKVYVWIRSPGESSLINGTVTLKNLYLIDTGEHSDEISKRWYTNIFPTSFNYASALNVVQKRSSKNGWPVVDITATSTDPWGWACYKLSGDEIIQLRGHTIELGCSTMIFSNGYTGHQLSNYSNYAFGIGVNTDNPNSYRLYSDTIMKSSVWDEKLVCLTCTIPEDATSICVGFRSYGYPAKTIVSLKNVYMYDLQEEVSIRGKDSTNVSLRLCRVKEEQENLTSSKIKNSLYVTEKGRIYSYDLKGNKVDIAGSIYAGAVEAGYNGNPNEFGAELYELIKGK